MKRNESERARSNLTIKDLLMNAATFRINPSSFQVGDVCPICICEFQADENIICLPCNPGHIFHDACIGEWVGINNNCPLCKEEITKEAIQNAEMAHIPLIEEK